MTVDLAIIGQAIGNALLMGGRGRCSLVRLILVEGADQLLKVLHGGRRLPGVFFLGGSLSTRPGSRALVGGLCFLNLLRRPRCPKFPQPRTSLVAALRTRPLLMPASNANYIAILRGNQSNLSEH